MVLLLLLALTHGFPTPAATSAPTSAPTPAPKVEYCDDASLVGCEHQQCLVDNTPGCLGATMKSRFGRGASPAAATAGKDKRKAVRIEARGADAVSANSVFELVHGHGLKLGQES